MLKDLCIKTITPPTKIALRAAADTKKSAHSSSPGTAAKD